MAMTLGKFRKLTKHLDDDTVIIITPDDYDEAFDVGMRIGVVASDSDDPDTLYFRVSSPNDERGRQKAIAFSELWNE